MSEPKETDDLDPRSVDLAKFIQDRSALLVVMGVFAAVAVYITQAAPTIGTSTDPELMYAIGFVSALGMTLLLLYLVYKELAVEAGSWHNLHHAHYRLDNLPLALFSLFNAMLVLSISFLITRYEPVIFILVLVAAVFAGGGIVLRFFYYVVGLLPESVWARIPAIFTLSLVTMLISTFVIMEYLAGVEISTIHEMSLTEPVPVAIGVAYILVISIRSVAALGVLVSLASIPLVAFDKIRGTSSYDNPE